MTQQTAKKHEPAARAKRWSAGPSYPILLIAVGLFTLVMSAGIERPEFINENDPGPATAPVATAAFLVVGGILLLVQWILGAGFTTVASQMKSLDRGTLAVFSGRGHQNVALVAVGLGLYIGVISVVGFSLATFLFATAMMVRLGTRWWVAGMVTGITIIVVHLVFVFMFRVPLPEGLFDAG